MSSQVCHKPPGPPPLTASCYICLETSAESSIDQPLLRNCACRGDAGWAHVACLAKFATSKAMEAEAQREQDHSAHIASFWDNCILCKTPYMQNMALAMAEAFVKQYEHLPDTNKLRFFSLYSLAMSRFDVGDYDGALELSVRLQELSDFLTTKGIDARGQEGGVLAIMGAVLYTKQQFNEALPIYERLRELCVAAFGPNSPEVESKNETIATLKEKIGIGGRGHQKGDTAAELLLARQKFKKCREDTTQLPLNRLGAYVDLTAALDDDGRYQEAMEQYELLITESRQTFGPDHPYTLEFEHHTNKYRQRMLQFETLMASNSSAAGATTSQKKDVWAVIDYEQQPAINGQRVQVLRATKDARKYICLIKNHNGVSTKFKVTQNQFILEAGTTVVVHGLVSSKDLNGSIGIICLFDKEKHRYAVSVGKKKTTVSIKPINLNVVFT